MYIHVVIPEHPHPDKVLSCEISTIHQLIDALLLFAGESKNWVYRGHSNAEWRLVPTIERAEDFKDLDSYALHGKETVAIEKFRELTHGRLDFGDNKFDWLSAMQHYGVPTRLLDFTRSFFVALFFAACTRTKQGDADSFAVWCLNLKKAFEKSEAVNKATSDEIEKSTEKPDDMSQDFFDQAKEVGETAIRNYAFFDECTRVSLLRSLANDLIDGKSEMRSGVIPVDLPNNNKRILSQDGLFIIPANFKGFEENLAETLGVDRNAFAPGIVIDDLEKVCETLRCRRLVCVKFIMPGALRADIMKLLTAANITPRTVYPDIPGIVPFVIGG